MTRNQERLLSRIDCGNSLDTSSLCRHERNLVGME